MELDNDYLKDFCGLGVQEIDNKLYKDFVTMSDISYARHVVYCYLVENRLDKNGEILKKNK